MNTTPATVTRLLSIVFTAAVFGGCDSAQPDVGEAMEYEALVAEDSDGIAAIEQVHAAHDLGADALTARPNPTHDPDDPDDIDAFTTSTVEPHGTSCPDADAPSVTYLGEDAEVCAEISVLCLAGWTNIDPACGCGCYRTSPTGMEDFTAELLEYEAVVGGAVDGDAADDLLAPGVIIVEPPLVGETLTAAG